MQRIQKMRGAITSFLLMSDNSKISNSKQIKSKQNNDMDEFLKSLSDKVENFIKASKNIELNTLYDLESLKSTIDNIIINNLYRQIYGEDK